MLVRSFLRVLSTYNRAAPIQLAFPRLSLCQQKQYGNQGSPRATAYLIYHLFVRSPRRKLRTAATTLVAAGTPTNNGAAIMSGPRIVPSKKSIPIRTASAAFRSIDAKQKRWCTGHRGLPNKQTTPSIPHAIKCSPINRKKPGASEGSIIRTETAKPSSTNTTLLSTANSECSDGKGRCVREKGVAFEAWYGF